MSIIATLARLLAPRRGIPTTTDAVLRRELAKRPEAHDLGALIPMLVPRAFSEVGWPGPIHRLAAGDFDQTWGVLGADDSLVYVSRAMQALWEGRGLAWRELAAANLKARAEAEPYNMVGDREDGSAFLVGMNYGQNLGPSRLLVPGLLKAEFGDGYSVAVPEMTCALAFTDTPQGDEAERIARMITGCFEAGSEPVSAGRYRPEAFWEVVSEDLGLPAD